MQFFKPLKERFLETVKRPDFRQQLKMWTGSWHVIAPGQFMRMFREHGHYVFPQFVRHHLSNVADGWMTAGSANLLQMGLCSIFGLEARSRPILSGIFGVAMQAEWELRNSFLPNRSFDWTDMGLHILSGIAYVGCSIYSRKKQEAANAAPETQIAEPEAINS